MSKFLKIAKKPAFWGAILAVAVGLGALEAGTAEGWAGILSELFSQVAPLVDTTSQ